MARREFHAMGTTIEVVLDAPAGAAAERAFDAVETEFERLEQILSRFRPDSELSLLNREGRLAASQDLAEVVGLALAARQETGGRFDPTVHDALVAAGYDRSFEELADTAHEHGRGAGEADAAEIPRCGGQVDLDGRTIRLQPGVRLDLGGIGKGFAAERAAELLSVSGPCLVSAGGDVAVRGTPAGGTWAVAVDDELTLGLDRGGLATSGRDRRRWLRDGCERHHLIDPSTGRPATTDILRITVVGRDAIDAEVVAKTLFLGGSEAALAAGVPVVVVTDDGHRLLGGGLS
jgi:FAD:protein FMN transferase